MVLALGILLGVFVCGFLTLPLIPFTGSGGGLVLAYVIIMLLSIGVVYVFENDDPPNE